MTKQLKKMMAIAVLCSFALTGCGTENDVKTDTETQEVTEAVQAKEELNLKVPNPLAKKGDKILFVGNSHTYVNDLPQIFYEMTEAFGVECDVYDLTDGGYYLEQFADVKDELGAKLDEGLKANDWDFVILQDNTNASASGNPEKDMIPYVEELDKKIKAAKGQTALFMTWAPKNGISSGMFKLSREEIQETIATSYEMAAEKIDGLLCPAGVALLKAAEQYPEIELWDEDGMHPSMAGSYLASCVIYAELFQKSPEGCTYTADLGQDVAEKLQTIASEVVLKKS